MMSDRNLIVGAIVAALVIGAVISITPRGTPVEKVVYENYVGDEPISVPIIISLPTDKLDQIEISPVSREFFCGDLIQLEGELPMELLKEPKPVVIQFIEHRSGKDLVANSGAAMPDGHSSELAIPVNVPQAPGIFDLQVMWGSASSYIARASVKVLAKPKSEAPKGTTRQ